MHRVDKTQTLFYLALLDSILNLRRNVDDVIAVLRVEPEIMGVGFHEVVAKSSTFK